MVRASGLRGYRSVIRELGEDPLPLLQRFGIPAAALDNDEAIVPLAAVCALLEASSEMTDCPDLGLRISLKQDIGVLGPLGIAMQNAQTPFEALQIASRYLFIHSPGLSLTINENSSIVESAIDVSIEIKLDGQPRQRQTVDLCLGTAYQIIRMLNPNTFRLKAVSIPHSPIAPLRIYQRHFSAPVSVNQYLASLHIASHGWDTPLVQGNPELKKIVEDYLSRHFNNPAETYSERVRTILRPLLGTPQASRKSIAAILAVHPRTLHRRLHAEGTTFHQIKDELRQARAKSYLEESEISLGQLSDLLGFPEQSAFSRACRSWFGMPPSAVRKRA